MKQWRVCRAFSVDVRNRGGIGLRTDESAKDVDPPWTGFQSDEQPQGMNNLNKGEINKA
jgi:hypothetical protein